MIQIYKSISETNSSLKQLDSIENGCWINIVAPSEEELILISKKNNAFLVKVKKPQTPIFTRFVALIILHLFILYE